MFVFFGPRGLSWVEILRKSAERAPEMKPQVFLHDLFLGGGGLRNMTMGGGAVFRSKLPVALPIAADEPQTTSAST